MVAQRFNALCNGDWGSVVQLWERDRIVAREIEAKRRSRMRKEVSEEEETQRRRRTVLALLAKGQISRAVSRINSLGVACAEDTVIRQQLAAKYPERGIEFPESVVKGKVVENMKGLRDILLGLDRCVSPGTGGLRGEFLTDLAEGMDQSQMDLLEEFGMKFLCGILPPWFYKVWLSVQTVPLYKAGGAVRPLGIRNQLLKSFHRETVTQNREVFTNFLEPQQLTMSRGGGAKLIFSVRTTRREARLCCC